MLLQDDVSQKVSITSQCQQKIFSKCARLIILLKSYILLFVFMCNILIVMCVFVANVLWLVSRRKTHKTFSGERARLIPAAETSSIVDDGSQESLQGHESNFYNARQLQTKVHFHFGLQIEQAPSDVKTSLDGSTLTKNVLFWSITDIF